MAALALLTAAGTALSGLTLAAGLQQASNQKAVAKAQAMQDAAEHADLLRGALR